MKINTISNQIHINNNKQSFGAKHQKHENENNIKMSTSHRVSTAKMLPVMMAMAGLTTMNSCSEKDIKYADMRDFKYESFENLSLIEDSLANYEEKKIVLSTEKDSIFKETDKFKYSHARFKSQNQTRIFGEITRKTDNKTLKFINVYDKDGNILSSTLKDPKTKESFYINYENGFFKEIHDKDGKPLKDEKERIILGLLALAAAAGGYVMFFSESGSDKGVRKD